MIPFIDLQSQQKLIKKDIDIAIQKVLSHGQYAMGPEVFELENKLSSFCSAKHTLSCSSGTDAIVLVLMALNIGAGDTVFVPSFTFCATAEAVVLVGATPMFINVLPDSFNMDPSSLKEAISIAKEHKLTAKAVIIVDLFGTSADYESINNIAKENNLTVIADAAQSFGGSYKGRKIGSLANITTTSFFPAKPLGCYGDGGAVFTDDDELYDVLKSIRIHGHGSDKYDNIRIGINGRLDTIQAAILLEKLKIFPQEILSREKIADKYNQALNDKFYVPNKIYEGKNVWAQYTLISKDTNREVVLKKLANNNIPVAIYYPIPLHKQVAYKGFPKVKNLTVTENLSNKVFSLPMHPYLTNEDQDSIIDCLLSD